MNTNQQYLIRFSTDISDGKGMCYENFDDENIWSNYPERKSRFN